MRAQPLVITTGEPAGIGMDIVLMLAQTGELSALGRPIWVLADAQVLKARADRLLSIGALTHGLKWQVVTPTLHPTINLEEIDAGFIDKEADDAFVVINVPCAVPVVEGQIAVENASMVLTQLQLAHQLAMTQRVAGIVTGPLQKSALIDAGLRLLDGSMFSGHTEFFMQQSGCDKVVMMLANPAMRVALVTTHLPLKDVPAAITAENVERTVEVVLNDLRQKFGVANPRVLVCGLNPHAGEGGHLGEEEIRVINPVLQRFIEAGVDISLAMPADTLFTKRHLEYCDAVIAMYHDQGLPVLKSHGFGDTVNLTLGLPYIRTSVDHGTALDLAGQGTASASSLYQAVIMAHDMAMQSRPMI